MLFGSDFAGWVDLDANMSVLDGDNASLLAFVQCIARRLSTPRGGLFYAPNEGFDIREFIGDTYEPTQAESIVEAECRKDERTQSVKCTVVVTGNESWQMSIAGVAKNIGPFALTLSVDKVTVQLLKAA